MGRRIQARNAEAEVQAKTWDVSLKVRTKKHDEEQASVETEDRKRVLGLLSLEPFFLRDPGGCPVIKSKNSDKRFLTTVRYLFNRYPVPQHLYDAWILEAKDLPNLWSEGTIIEERGKIFRNWYLCVAQGGSLYKQHAKSYLTKAEVHHFLICSHHDISLKEALWYAAARAAGASVGYAQSIARTKLKYNVFGTFWCDVARWFVLHQAEKPSIKVMNELIDYVSFRFNQNPLFTLSGQTVEGVKRRAQVWHRDLIRMKNIGGGSWEGHKLGDKTFTTARKPEANVAPVKFARTPAGQVSKVLTGKSSTKVMWTFVQIKTGDELAKEGNAMRHCVASYKHQCIEGKLSIWSLRRDGERALTIEVRDGKVTQARGIANRMPRIDEAHVLRTWAKAAGLNVISYV